MVSARRSRDQIAPPHVQVAVLARHASPRLLRRVEAAERLVFRAEVARAASQAVACAMKRAVLTAAVMARASTSATKPRGVDDAISLVSVVKRALTAIVFARKA